VQRATEVHATAVGQAHVEHGDVDLVQRQAQRLSRLPASATTLRSSFDSSSSRSPPDDLMVVNEEESDHVSPVGSRSPHLRTVADL